MRLSSKSDKAKGSFSASVPCAFIRWNTVHTYWLFNIYFHEFIWNKINLSGSTSLWALQRLPVLIQESAVSCLVLEFGTITWPRGDDMIESWWRVDSKHHIRHLIRLPRIYQMATSHVSSSTLYQLISISAEEYFGYRSYISPNKTP